MRPKKKVVRERAIAEKGNGVGKFRYELYKKNFRRIKESIGNGYYLEAITLVESLLSDRLESRLTYLKCKEAAFQNLGLLCPKINEHESDDILKSLIDAVNKWRDKRNKSLHEMAKMDRTKMEKGKELSYEKRILKNKKIAVGGLKILESVKSRIEKLKRIPTPCPPIESSRP